MYDLTSFTLGDMTECGAALRKLGADATSMEDVAGRIVSHLFHHLRAGRSGDRACVLARFFLTQPYGRLTGELRSFARRLLGGQPGSPAMKCFMLLATAGVRPDWNARQASKGHQAIPLPSADMLTRLPMIAQLVQQFGLEPNLLIEPDPALLIDHGQRTYNVFHVAQAHGSPHVPAQQEFVVPFGVQSALGFGGPLSSGDFFVVILFAKVPIARETAELFKPLALSVKLAALPFAGGPIFNESSAVPGDNGPRTTNH